VQDWPFLRYRIHVYERINSSKIDNPEKATKERNQKKLRGEKSVYSELHAIHGGKFGIEGLKAFREDLFPEKFWNIVGLYEKRGLSALEIVVWMNLFMYQYSFLTKMGADYLKNKAQ